MPAPQDALRAAGPSPQAIDFRRLSWSRPLQSAFADDFASVATLFPGNPADPAAWRQTIARVQRRGRDRALLPAMLGAQLDRRNAPEAARAAARTLADTSSVAVLTGQQAGAFGGPLYTLLKAITAIQIARSIRRDHGVPAVPIFWVDAEDHDWNEIRSATVLDRDFQPAG